MKKFIGLILAVVLCLSVIPMSAVAIAENYELSEAKQVINTLGTIAPLKETVTRRDFAVMLYSVVFGKENVASGNRYFHDVDPDDASSSALDALAEMGIISGGGAQLFHPDNEIKPSEAIKMLVCMLGRGELAKARGGYPTGYMRQAQEAKLLSGLDSLSSDMLSRDDALVMLYRAIDAEIIRENVVSDEKTVMKESSSTPLEIYRGIVFREGVLEATELSGIGGAIALNNHVVVSGLSLYCDKGYVRNYLGHNVKAYYSDDDVREVYLILDSSRRNDIIKVKAEDVLKSEAAHSLEKLSYTDEDGDAEVQKISQEADFIYNGVLYKGMRPSDFIFDSGYIELLDNDADGVTDLVSITAYEHYVIEMIDTKRMEIYGKDGKGFSYAASSGELDLYNASGTAINPSSLIKGDVVSVAKSRDGKVKTVWRNQTKSKGSISELGSEGDTLYAEINGDSYAVNKNYALTTEWQQISAGTNGEFYLNILNEIVYAEVDGEDGVKYAFLLEADMGEGLSKNIKLKVLTEDNEHKTLEGADKIRVNGGKATDNHEGIYTTLKCGDPLIRQQLIKFSLDDEGKVKTIDIPEIMDEWNGASEFYRTQNKQLVYLNGPTLLSNYFVGNCKVYFNIEREEERMGHDYRVKENDIFASRVIAMHSNYRYYCTMYDYGYANNAQACVVEPYPSSVVFLSKMLVADRVVTTVDEDGDQVRKLYGWYNGYAVSYVISDVAEIRYASELTNITRGDVFRFNFSKNNGMEIGFIKRLYKSSAPWTEGITVLEGENSENAMVSKYGAATGTVYALDYPVITLQINGVKYTCGANNTTSVFVYDEEADRVYASNFDEIRSILDTGEGSRVAIYTEYGLVRDLLLIKPKEA